MRDKIDNQEGLSHRDMFKLADLNDSGQLDMKEFKQYFKKLGFIFSDHRVKEIFAYAKLGSEKSNGREQELNEGEFKRAYEYIQK